MNRKTIVLIVQQGFSARVLIQSDVLAELAAADCRLVVLTTDADAIRTYLDHRGMPHVAVEAMDTRAYERIHRSWANRVFRLIRAYALRVNTVDVNFEMRWKDLWIQRRILNLVQIFVIRFISELMRRSLDVAKAIVGLENRLFCPRAHDAFFRQYRPDIAVLTSMGTFDYDALLMREARRHHCGIVSYILSWDNTTVRGLGVNLNDSIIAWSQPMVEELTRLHRIPTDMITIGGVPHYDHYRKSSDRLQDRETLSGRIGFDPRKRIIFLCATSPNIYLCNTDVAELICRAIDDGRISDGCQLMVRLHPISFRKKRGAYVFQQELDEWRRLFDTYGGRCLSIDYPAMLSGRMNLLMPDDEIPKLASMLNCSDVVVNFFSTMNIEACIFDKPCINVGFQFNHRKPTGNKISRFNITYDESLHHVQRVLNTGGAVVAHSPAELIDQINRYLETPSLHAEGRRRMIANECGAHLGKSGPFVARAILAAAGAARPERR